MPDDPAAAGWPARGRRRLSTNGPPGRKLAVERVLAFRGHCYGLRHPVLLASLSAGQWPAGIAFAALNARLGEIAGEHAAPESPPPASQADDPVALALLLLHWMHRLQRAAGLPVFEAGRVVGGSAQQGSVIVALPAPAGSGPANADALHGLANAFDAVLSGASPEPVLAGFGALREALAAHAPSGSNVPRFLRAAFDMGIPVAAIPGQLFQFGQSARGRWLDSSFTDRTPRISARLARNKMLAAEVLREAGLPVPAHRRVDSAQAALDAAAALGYPVVVKPADLDGGAGVAAGLTTPAQVRAAYDSAARLSRNVLVEKHVEGRDYRLVVFQGALIWAIERVPGGVTGDGANTVAALVARVNADPRRGTGATSPLKRIALDDEALELLAASGMAPDSVPRADEFVRLRRTSNIATGGTPVAALDRVHPDNRLLAIRASAALGLDLAGIDLLIPDIARSWREHGAAICEVNGQPNLGQTTSAHLYGLILRSLVTGDGRIPIVVIVGDDPDGGLAGEIADGLRAAGLTPGRASRDGVSVGDDVVLDGPAGVFEAGRVLMRDRGVDAAVVSIDDRSVLGTGLPFDRFDVLVIAGPSVAATTAAGAGNGERLQRRPVADVLAAIAPNCDGAVVRVADGADPVSAQGSRIPSVPRDRVAQAALRALLAADERHRGAARGG